MRWIRFSFLILLTAILQASIFAKFDIKPDLLLIVLVFFAIYSNTTEAIITSFIIGFCSDLIGNVIGPGMISYTLFGTLLAYMHRVIAVRKMRYQATTIFIVGLMGPILAAILALLKSQMFNSELLTIIFWTAVCSAFVGPFLFSPFAWWMHIKPDRFRRQ